MKKLKTLLFLLLWLIIPNTLIAEPSSGTSASRPPVTLKPSDKGGHIKRPKAPNRQVVTCTYEGEEMFLTFVYSEGVATLQLTDETMITSTYEIDTSVMEVTLTVGKLTGCISIEMETEKGSYFTGLIE